ncbi:MAG: arginase family protein [Kibdelosporangium sp.]
MARLRKTVPFCGLPFARLAGLAGSTAAAVVGVGSSHGSPNDGAENGPFFVRMLSKAYTWGAATPAVLDLSQGDVALHDVVDLGDVESGPAQPGATPLDQVLADVAAVVGALPGGVVPAVIGGDHTVTLPVVAALAAARTEPFSVVQFDHHLDLQVWGDSDASRERIFHTNVMSHVADRLGAGRLVQVGVNPYAVVEAASAGPVGDYVRSVGRQIPVFSSELADVEAFRGVVGDGDVYVTVDVDVLNDAEMSSTGYPAEFGMTLHNLLGLIDALLASNRLVGFDVVEFAAGRDDRDRKTLADAARASHIFLRLLGWASRQAAARRRQATA